MIAASMFTAPQSSCPLNGDLKRDGVLLAANVHCPASVCVCVRADSQLDLIASHYLLGT